MKLRFLMPILFLYVSCTKTSGIKPVTPPDTSILSLFGDTLHLPPASENIRYRLDTVNANYLDQFIWYGRFTAYAGDYPGAIRIFSEGIEKFPDEPRFYRHRGHRYISIRKFDLAIADLKKASELISGTENEIEPDGMPNAQNIPVSTLHGNIWYHLGLAYYLEQDWENARLAYENCLGSTQNDDNIVSATHWLYMIAKRMGDDEGATEYLDLIQEEMDVIENHAYHRACLFYKGLLPLDSLINPDGESSSNDAIGYAVGNWYFYNGDRENAELTFRQITTGPGWNSFGYIAAEADLYNEFSAR